MINSPATESTLSAAHLAIFLQEHYDLGINTSCKLFRTGMNHLYIVTDNDTKYVLRIYTHNWRTKTEIAEELRLLLHLKEHNIPVSYPIADRAGELIQEFNAAEGLRYGVLFSYAPGEKKEKFDTETSYHIGVLMARMHQATQEFTLNRTTYNVQTLLTGPLAGIKAFFTNPSADIQFIEKLAKHLTDAYNNANTNELKNTALHMDMWFDNMHFDAKGDITLFDFDFCGTGWRIHDISYFLYQLYNTNQGDGEYQPKADSFMQGYESIARLTDEEKRLLLLGCISTMLLFISVQCQKYDTWSNIFLNEYHLSRLLAQLKRWIAFNDLKLI